MLTWFTQFDPTVQVAMIGAIGAVIAGLWAAFKVWLQPDAEDKAKEYGPRPISLVLAEADQLRLDRAVFVVESLSDTIERLRVQISLTR